MKMDSIRLGPAAVALALFVAAGVLSIGVAYEQTITLPTGQQATINWDDGELHATGQAVPPSNAETEGQKRLLARRGAILDAQRNLLETLSQVQVTSDSTMINLMANDVVRTQVEGIVQGAIVMNEEWDAAAEIYTVGMAIPLASARQIVEEPDEPSANPPAATIQLPTGLVFDVRDLNAVPSLSFRVFTRSGVEVTAGARGYYVTALPGGLGTPVADVVVDPRVADEPFVIRVVALEDNRIDLIVSDADGERLQQYLVHRNFFRDGRTLLIMN